jgi:hypothetical protein
VKGALVPGDRLSPEVRVAVIVTPVAAGLSVTPLIVTVFCPAGIVPVVVPPIVLPVADSEMPVAVLTLAG